MSNLFTTKVRDLLIPLGNDTTSPVVQGAYETQDAESLLITCPYNAQAENYVIQVCPKEDATDNDTFYNLIDENGNAVGLPSPGTARIYKQFALPSWRIKAISAVANDTIFSVFKTHRC